MAQSVAPKRKIAKCKMKSADGNMTLSNFKSSLEDDYRDAYPRRETSKSRRHSLPRKALCHSTADGNTSKSYADALRSTLSSTHAAPRRETSKSRNELLADESSLEDDDRYVDQVKETTFEMLRILLYENRILKKQVKELLDEKKAKSNLKDKETFGSRINSTVSSKGLLKSKSKCSSDESKNATVCWYFLNKNRGTEPQTGPMDVLFVPLDNNSSK